MCSWVPLWCMFLVLTLSAVTFAGEDLPHVWLECGRTQIDCDLFGLVYNPKPPQNEESDICVPPVQRIRCDSPSTSPLTTTPANHLEVVTYNVFELSYAVRHSGQSERTCRIPRWLVQNIPDVDVIVFQELFMGGCFPGNDSSPSAQTMVDVMFPPTNTVLSIRDLLAQHGFHHWTEIMYNVSHIENGGIVIVSRWEIVEQGTLVFEHFLLPDGLAAKGVAYAKIKKTDDTESMLYNVFGTHFHSVQNTEGNTLRLQQATEWRDWMDTLNLPTTEPVVLAGDFNAVGDTLDAIFEILDAAEPKVSLDLYTSEPVNNVKDDPDETPYTKLIDYVLLVNGHRQPIEDQMEVLVAHASEKFPVCWIAETTSGDPIPIPFYMYPGDLQCDETREITHLSDHEPVLGTFVF